MVIVVYNKYRVFPATLFLRPAAFVTPVAALGNRRRERCGHGLSLHPFLPFAFLPFKKGRVVAHGAGWAVSGCSRSVGRSRLPGGRSGTAGKGKSDKKGGCLGSLFFAPCRTDRRTQFWRGGQTDCSQTAAASPWLLLGVRELVGCAILRPSHRVVIGQREKK